MKRCIILYCLFAVLATPAMAAYKDGMSAYERKDYATAHQEFKESANQGDAEAQYMLGYLYGKGEGVVQNYVEAYKWFNLSAARGNKKSRESRDIIAKNMTAEQVALAQQLSSNWEPSSPLKIEKKASEKSGESLQQLIGNLRELTLEAERKSASDPWVIERLWALVRQYDWPWQKKVLQETFADGDYTDNPRWTVASGKFKVESDGVLRSIFSPPEAETQQDRKEPESLSLAILDTILRQSTSREAEPEKKIAEEYAEIYIPQSFTNAFALHMTIKSFGKEGRIEFGPYQGEGRNAGYRLVYAPGSANGLELLRLSSSRSAVVELYNETLNLEDSQAHTIEYTRDKKGAMTVSVDGKELLRVTDRGIADDFDGFTIVNRGGDYSFGEVTIFGIGESD